MQRLTRPPCIGHEDDEFQAQNVNILKGLKSSDITEEIYIEDKMHIQTSDENGLSSKSQKHFKSL